MITRIPTALPVTLATFHLAALQRRALRVESLALLVSLLTETSARNAPSGPSSPTAILMPPSARLARLENRLLVLGNRAASSSLAALVLLSTQTAYALDVRREPSSPTSILARQSAPLALKG